MLSLEQIQQTMIQALSLGPDHVPEGLFAGGRMAGLRGLKVHANTISHARLVALEETFPRTLARIGHARFNEHSRQRASFTGGGSLPKFSMARIASAVSSTSFLSSGVIATSRRRWLVA